MSTDEFTRILDERNSLEADYARLREDYERVVAEQDEARRVLAWHADCDDEECQQEIAEALGRPLAEFIAALPGAPEPEGPASPPGSTETAEKPAVVVADPDTAQAGTGALDAAIEAAVRPLRLADFGPTDPPRYSWEQAGPVNQRRYYRMAEAAVRAAAPLIPVTEQQRADIERDALLRAAEDVGVKWNRVETIADWLRTRAASVGTEEGR